MSLNKFIKENESNKQTYQKFKEKNNIDFNDEKNEIYLNKRKNIFKSKPFKLSITLTILSLVISLSIFTINYINKPKYQEYHFTQEEIFFMQFGSNGINSWRYIYNLSDAITNHKEISYAYVTTTFGYYIVGYYDSDKKFSMTKLADVTWYMFSSDDIPYNIKNQKVCIVIQCDKEYYHKDVITNMEINKTKDRYSKCSYEIDMENNKVSNVKKLRYNNVNQENLALINRIDEEKDLERFNVGINSTLMFVFFTPVGTVDSTYYENEDFYNIIVKDNKRYVVMRIWEEENNKQLCDQLLKIKEGEMEIEKVYNGGIVKETRDLYLLENLMEVIQNIQ